MINFVEPYKQAIMEEYNHVKKHIAKIPLFDGKFLYSDIEGFVYSFNSEKELSIPDSSPVTVYNSQNSIPGEVMYINGDEVVLCLNKKIDTSAKTEFSSSVHELLLKLIDRLENINYDSELVKQLLLGAQYINNSNIISKGQELAIQHSLDNPITILWGPPGTGKTYTLAEIAWSFYQQGKSVLIVSQSNIAVDNAIIEVKKKMKSEDEGKIFRAGYSKNKVIMDLANKEDLYINVRQYDRIMVNFGKWYYNDEFTPTGEMFDVGNTCSIAIENYIKYKKPYTMCGLNSEKDNGNGSLMRIHPVVLYLADKEMQIEEKIEIVHTMSALTHAHNRSKIGCGIYAFVLWELLKNPTMYAIKDGLAQAEAFYQNNLELAYYSRLFDKTFIITPRNLIKSSGYIVDTLEAALWCLLTTNSYKEAVLKAVNLGDDTDTVAAIAGGLAGALYGYDAIPKEWRDTLIEREYIESLCNQMT